MSDIEKGYARIIFPGSGKGPFKADKSTHGTLIIDAREDLKVSDGFVVGNYFPPNAAGLVAKAMNYAFAEGRRAGIEEAERLLAAAKKKANSE